MPYPFVAAMTFNQLCNALEENYGCAYKKGDELFKGNEKSFTISYITREFEGKVISLSVDFEDGEERVNPNVLRSICKRLKINITEFPGYHLG